MSTVVVDPSSPEPLPKEPRNELAHWVMARVSKWRRVRDAAYKDRWDDYYRTWRGRFEPAEKAAMAQVGQVRQKQRSKLISPISSMAVDLTVAEIVEALFGRERFVDLPDDMDDADKEDLLPVCDRLIEDLYKDGIISSMSEIVLNGALYGTGIAKVNLDVEEVATPKRSTKRVKGPDGKDASIPIIVKAVETRVRVYPSAIEPGQFVPDPSASSIDDMLGCAHEFPMPLHKIRKRQRAGTYLAVPVGTFGRELGTSNRHEGDSAAFESEYALVSEYHGLVPSRMLAAAGLPVTDMIGQAALQGGSDTELTEAIVTIANEGILLRAIPNPSAADDRAIDAYQHDQVSNRFWGRGVMEKGFHPQKAMDAELRARVDTLAWTSNPMLVGDVTKMPAKMNLDVWPGKFWPVKGNPKETIQEMRFGDVGQATFAHAEALERMSQQATGALDSIMSIRGNVRDETATGSAMSASGFLKRAKRTMFNIETFFERVIRKVLWRKMQFDPARYPADFEFQVKGAIGIMAREVETAQMASALQYTEEGSPVRMAITRALFEHSASPAKGAILQAIDAQLKPNPEAEAKAKQMEQLQMQLVMEEVNNMRAKTALMLSQGDKAKAEALLARIETDFKKDEMFIESVRVALDAKNNQQETANQAEQNAISREKNEIARAKLRQDARKTKSGE